jgi:hypothetical protein
MTTSFCVPGKRPWVGRWRLMLSGVRCRRTEKRNICPAAREYTVNRRKLDPQNSPARSARAIPIVIRPAARTRITNPLGVKGNTDRDSRKNAAQKRNRSIPLNK